MLLLLLLPSLLLFVVIIIVVVVPWLEGRFSVISFKIEIWSWIFNFIWILKIYFLEFPKTIIKLATTRLSFACNF